MQTEQTLLDLGFQRYPEWDIEIKDFLGKTIEVIPNYRFIDSKRVWRAKPEINNGAPYVILGMVFTSKGLVDRWRDCCSPGSVLRKISK